MTTPIAVLISDLHLSKNPPVARSAEPDWFEAIRRQWQPIHDENLPIIIAGDIFDHWNAPAEVIRLAIELFQDRGIYAIPGQHDLPNHGYEERHRSAYGVLEECGAIINLNSGKTLTHNRLFLHGFPWNVDVVPLPQHYIEAATPSIINLAVCHKYIWDWDAGYHQAPEQDHLGRHTHVLKGYDAAVFGDNHIHFTAHINKQTHVFNCGGFMPRTTAERDKVSYYGLLMDDGTVTAVALPNNEDKWIDKDDTPVETETNVEFTELVEYLETLSGQALDFHEAVDKFLQTNPVDPNVKEAVLSCLEPDE